MRQFNNAFPQRGIIEDVNGRQANVFIPLAKYETGLIDSCIYLDSTMIGQEVIVVFVNGDRNQGVIMGVTQ